MTTKFPLPTFPAKVPLFTPNMDALTTYTKTPLFSPTPRNETSKANKLSMARAILSGEFVLKQKEPGFKKVLSNQ